MSFLRLARKLICPEAKARITVISLEAATRKTSERIEAQLHVLLWWVCILTFPLTVRCLYGLIRIEWETRLHYFKALGILMLSTAGYFIYSIEQSYQMIGITTVLLILGTWFTLNHLLAKFMDFIIDDSWWKKAITSSKKGENTEC